jgi:plasmid stabilization system protein ParE
MRSFAVTWSAAASLELLGARAYLGVVRAYALDDEVDRVTERLAALPESGAPTEPRRGQWSREIRKVVLSRNPYTLYYRLDLEAERVVIVAVRHQRRSPPRL